MDLPTDLLTRPAAEAVRWVARGHLDALAQAAGRLADPEDGAALHDARVALRRLRSTLSTWKGLLKGSARGKDRARLRDLQRSTAQGRDAEVSAAWLAARRAGPDAARGARTSGWLEARLSRVAGEARLEAAERLNAWLEGAGRRLRKRLSTTFATLGETYDGPGQRYAAALASMLEARAARLFKSLAGLQDAQQVKQAHAARVAGKRLRYVLEPVAGTLTGGEALLAQLRSLQDRLGDIQDLAVLGQTLEESVGSAALEQAQRLSKAAQRGVAAPGGGRDPRRSGLLALTREVEAARVARFDGLLAHLRAGDLPAVLAAGVQAVVAAAAHAAHAGLEIERKFLLRALPVGAPEGEVLEVEQGWLPGERLQERLRRVRRRTEVQHVRTVKLGRGLTRVEVEEPTDARTFDLLWPLTQGCRVLKRRTRIPVGAHVWEIDEFLDRDLVLAEVELSSAEETVTPPPWLAEVIVRDVTEEDAYVNRVLAR